MSNLPVPGGASSSPTSSQLQQVVNGGWGSCFGGIPTDRETRITSVVEFENGDPMELMAREMNRLSLQEREQAYEDLHGVSAVVHETPQLIAAALQIMEHHLQCIRHKPAYILAEANRKDYVQDANLRLMFLRAERFDVEKAANRLVRWLDWKLELFGKEILCQKHIGLDELDADARLMVESGIMQVLPERDSCGRVVQALALRYRYHWGRSSKSLLQMFFYIAMVAAEDETNQKNGLVNILYGLGKEQAPIDSSADHGNIDETYEILGYSSLTTCLPLRWDAVHFLTNSRALQYSMAMYTKTIGWHVRARLRVHIGSHLEGQYGLMSFGLPSSLLPFTEDCELKTNNHKKWIQRRSVKDQEVLRRQQSNPNYVFPGIDLPGRNDILLGQGRPIQDHPGNRRLHELVEVYFDEYNSAPKDGGKADVARKIILEINKSSTFGGAVNMRNSVRFLQLSKLRGWWEEVTDEGVQIEKVCNRLRNARQRKTPK